MGENEMSVFGIPEAEEEVYRHFLRHPGTRADDLHLLLHSGPVEARARISRLQELGLLHTEDAERRIFPADPEVALARLAGIRLRELHQELRRVNRSQHVIDGLRAERGARTPPPRGVERLEGPAEIRNRIEDLTFFAREEILSVEPYTRLSAENIARARLLGLRCLRRGVRIRKVVSGPALQDPPTAACLRELAERGAAIRVSAETTERVLVYDRRTAVVPVDPGDASRGALLAHRDGLVSNAVSLFERIWEQSGDLSRPDSAGGVEGGEDAAVPGPSGVERRVLVSMCTVGKDEAGARGLGVSVRTYRRHVADLMQRLGAASRVQAALLARERGWI
ncbi:helix-turn-helix transcriptional regulator [Streptomyces sp. NPDC006270]|uniref:helix-turn-helix transcriptional regulator n=1 Tax=Streptomyces sp. NPDC006270 TaxID=3364741 RepID=UPI00367429BA